MKRLLPILLIITLLIPAVMVYASDNKIPMDNCKVTFAKDSYEYTGNGITPAPKVTYKKKTLRKDVDYNIYYKDNVNVGTATVTLVGLGKYTGSTTVSFSIRKGTQTIKASDITATYGDEPVYIYAEAKNPLSYKSSDESVATISGVGTVTFVGTGECKITITAEGNANVAPAKKTIKVKVKKAPTHLVAFGSTIHPGDKHNIAAQCSSNGKLTYESSNKKVATVSKKGVVKAIKVGTAKITVKAAATKNFKAAKATVVVKVVKK